MANPRSLGGRPVAPVGFGAMQLPGKGVMGPPKDREAALAVLRRAVELGVDHIDTAQFYGPDVANELIHSALFSAGGYPDGLRIVTKVGARRDDAGAWLPALGADELRDQVEQNLDSLGLDRLDTVNLRVHGPEDPIEEPLGVLAALRDEGKIEHLGVSEVTLDQLDRAQAVTEIACVQNLLNVMQRDSMPVQEACGERGIAFVPYFPLGSGFAAGPRKLGRIEAVKAAAEAHEASVAQVALAWLLGLGDHILLIPGTSSVDHLEENLAAADLALTVEQLKALDAVG